MKTRTFVLIVGIILSMASKMQGQVFPEIWDRTSYDYSQGQLGKMEVINYGGQSTPWENKAFIFATTVEEYGIYTNKDLFRLTCQGISTLNSPFANYEVGLNFCYQQQLQGGITGSYNTLRLFGKNKLLLGLHNNNTLITVENQKTTFAHDMRVDYDNHIMHFGLSGDHRYGWIGSQSETNVAIGTNYQASILLDTSRNVYIGVTVDTSERIRAELKNKYSLFVGGGVLSEDYAIAPVSSWSDFVFSKEFNLRPLEMVEKYIVQEHHLPDVPSEKEVTENGYSQHDINKVLLQKIEELTLYIIEQKKEIENLKKEIENK